MVKLDPYKPLTDVLDRFISDYKAPGRTIGQPNDNPQLDEDGLKTLIMKKGDRIIAAPEDTYAFFMDYPDSRYEKAIEQAAGSMFPASKLLSISGRFHYPPKGYMGWHTNSNAEGTRLYATFVPEGGKSYFRYYDMQKKEIVTEWEKEGWNFRAFAVRVGSPYWHCIYTDTDRYSFGLRYQLG
jgi:hypothetical protein